MYKITIVTPSGETIEREAPHFFLDLQLDPPADSDASWVSEFFVSGKSDKEQAFVTARVSFTLAEQAQLFMPLAREFLLEQAST